MLDQPMHRARNTVRKLILRVAEPLRAAGHVWRDSRAVAAGHGVSTISLLTEMLRLRATHSLGVQAYFQYRLFDPRLSREDKLRFLSDRWMHARRIWSLLTPKRYRALYDNKLIFNRFFGRLGLPVAEIYAVYDPAVGFATDGRSLRSTAELRSWMESFAGEGFVFKPAEGGQGQQILVFAARAPGTRDAFLTLAGERYDAERLVAFTRQTAHLEVRDPEAHPHAYLLQERVRPHPAVGVLVGGPTLCTVRVVTTIGLDGEPKIMTAAFKVQTEPVGADNFHGPGAVGCWVDPDTGVLGQGRTRTSLEPTSLIPGSSRQFVGFQLPDWPRLREAVLRAAAAFPWARGIGWDVAVAEGGPVLIEGNDHWGTPLVQMTAPRGLLTDDFRQLCETLARDRAAKDGLLKQLGPGRVWRFATNRAKLPSHTWQVARDVSRTHGLSRWRMLWEQALLHRRYGIGPKAYYYYQLFRPELSWEEKSRYLPDDVPDRGEATVRMYGRLTPRRYRALYDNKVMFSRFFGSVGLNVAEIYGIYDPAVGRTVDGEPLRGTDDLRRWLERFPGESFVFKPAEGGKGRKILAFASRAPGESAAFLTLAGERYDAVGLAAFARQTALLEDRDPAANPHAYLLQERVRAHPMIADLVGGPTLCTVRVQTFVALDGKPRLLAAVFKMQSGLTGVDNLSMGGVGCWVDLETGALGPGRPRNSRDDVTVVPGTTREFVGFRLPLWAEVREATLRAAAAFPWARAIGWDVAITDRGPLLIEGNDSWSPSILQLRSPGGLNTGEFKALLDALTDGRGQGAARGGR
jgi:hypothetical protein